jgi:hypothetical protein
LLLDRVTDTGSLGGYYARAVEEATNEGHTEIVRLLVERGGEVSLPEPGSRLKEAISKHNAIIQLLDLLDGCADYSNDPHADEVDMPGTCHLDFRGPSHLDFR